jgi:hypothetical protein
MKAEQKAETERELTMDMKTVKDACGFTQKMVYDAIAQQRGITVADAKRLSGSDLEAALRAVFNEFTRIH